MFLALLNSSIVKGIRFKREKSEMKDFSIFLQILDFFAVHIWMILWKIAFRVFFPRYLQAALKIFT